jgi:hypothetical protein
MHIYLKHFSRFCSAVASTSLPPPRSLHSLLSHSAGVAAALHPIPQTMRRSQAAAPRNTSVDKRLQQHENTGHNHDDNNQSLSMVAASQDDHNLEDCDELVCKSLQRLPDD